RALEAENHLLRQTADQPNLAAASGINRVALRDRLLEASAQTVSALLTVEDFDEAIDTALQTLCRALGCNQAVIVEFTDTEASPWPHWQILYKWSAADGPWVFPHPSGAAGDHVGIEAIYARLCEGEIFSTTPQALIPEPLRSQQRPEHDAALHHVPVMMGDRPWGVMGFDDCDAFRDLSAAELSMLSVAAICLGSAITRQRTQQALQGAEQAAAAKQQAAELAKANGLLRSSLSRLSTEPNLTDVLGQLLVELVEYAGAAVGHIFIHDALQDTLTLKVRCRDGQAFWSPASDEPTVFQSPIPTAVTPIFPDLCRQPRLAVLNKQDFKGQMWPGVLEWFEAKGYHGTCSHVLLVGDRPLGMLAMAFKELVVFQSVEEELVLSLTQQLALVIQLTQLSDADKQRAIAHERENERNRVAQEVHDTLAQSFTGVLMQLEVVRRKIDLAQLSVAQTHVAQARSLAQTGLQEARRSVRALRPAPLIAQDLPHALRQLAQQMTGDSDIQIRAETRGANFSLPTAIENNLLRIAQEALTNALRHAAPQNVYLQLHFVPSIVQLRVHDDGTGFNPQSQTSGGFGLWGMQERTRSIGGEFELTSDVGKGTEIAVTVPLPTDF
ncbi:MAG: GAF domain-containing sensor histidine kinase, partial [Cyanobacteria bacterium P01_A01_bin.135]